MNLADVSFIEDPQFLQALPKVIWAANDAILAVYRSSEMRIETISDGSQPAFRTISQNLIQERSQFRNIRHMHCHYLLRKSI